MEDVAGNREAIQELVAWIASWKRRAPRKRAVLLHGPAGTGKTVSAEAAANDYNFDLVEVNASDKRSREIVERIVGAASSQAGLFGMKRLILLDEIDGINPTEDRGAADAIVKIIETTRCPIILTANDAWDPKVGAIRNTCTLIQFKRLGLRDSIPYLKKICSAEGVEVNEPALRLIVDRNQGDMRSIMNDLQALSAGRRRLSYDDVKWLAYRDRRETIFEALRTVFTAKNCLWAKKAVDMSDVDYEMLFEWIYENAPRQLSHPEDLAKALDALARADLYLARIKREQAWGLLGFFFDAMTAGVAMSREKTKPSWVPMKFPERIQLLSRTRRLRSLRARIGAKIGAKSHISSIRALKHYLPYVRFIFENSEQEAARMAKWLELDEEAVGYLAGDEKKSTRILELAGS